MKAFGKYVMYISNRMTNVDTTQ